MAVQRVPDGGDWNVNGIGRAAFGAEGSGRAEEDLALVVEPLSADRNARGGLHRRVFLWTTNEIAAAAAPSVRGAGIVLKWVRADKEVNLRRLEPMVREAAPGGGARIVVTTECVLDGYAIQDKSIPLETYQAPGEAVPGGACYERLSALARELQRGAWDRRQVVGRAALPLSLGDATGGDS